MTDTEKDPRLGRVAVAGVVALLLVILSVAVPPRLSESIPPEASQSTAPLGSPPASPQPTGPGPTDLTALPTDFAEPSASVAPTSAPPTARTPTPRPTARPQRTSPPSSIHPLSVKRTGTATWYCCTRGYPSGLYAAAGPGIRVGNWRGRYVRVCAGSRCVRVRLIDWCACGHGRVIDLYPEAFRRLAPLSRGVVRVQVSW